MPQVVAQIPREIATRISNDIFLSLGDTIIQAQYTFESKQVYRNSIKLEITNCDIKLSTLENLKLTGNSNSRKECFKKIKSGIFHQYVLIFIQ